MRRNTLIFVIAILTVTGCQTPNQTNGAVGGGVIGGIIGTGVGIATRNPAAGMLIGAGTGAAVGSVVGANQDKKEIQAAQAQAQAYAAAHPPLQLADVVSMTNRGISDSVIIQQMISTNSYYNLTPADIDYLKTNNVRDGVILAMQQRTVPRPVVVRPAPYYVYPPPPPPVAVGVGVRF